MQIVPIHTRERPLNELLTAYIESYRQVNELTVRKMAERMGYGYHTTLSNVINGKRHVTLNFLKRLSTLTGESIDTLAALSEGRVTRVTADTTTLLRIAAQLQQEYQILYDLLIVGLAHLDNPAYLEQIIQDMKNALPKRE